MVTQENDFENVFCITATILSRPRSAKGHSDTHGADHHNRVYGKGIMCLWIDIVPEDSREPTGLGNLVLLFFVCKAFWCR